YLKYIVQNIDGYTSALKHGRIVDKCSVLCCPVGVKLAASAKHLGSSSQTAWRSWQRSELPAHQVPSGTVLVAVAPLPHGVRPHIVALSARVSSAENRTPREEQRERQADRVVAVACCAAKGWQGGPGAKGGKEGGSGVTDQRAQVLAWLAETSVSHSAAAQQERGSRFGVASLQTVWKTP